MMKNAFKWLIGIFAVLLVVGGFFLFTPVLQNTLGLSTDIFCNDYEFTCCVPTTSAPVTTNVGATSLFQCPLTATGCEVKQYSPSNTYLFTSISTPVVRKLASNLFISLYDSPDMIMKQNRATPFTLLAGQYLWADRSTSISYTVGGQKLTFCGRAGCTQGADIKSDSCAFSVSTGRIYDASTKSDKGVSYTVPAGQCVLAWQSSDRHICGTILDECTTTADCVATHSNTCTARTLQSYECRPASSLPSTVAYVNGQYVSTTQDPFGTANVQYTRNQCQIATAQQVQCCGDTDCGSSQTCDTVSHICKSPELVGCTASTVAEKCGVSTQCDYTTLKLKSPACISGGCGYTSKSVGCCSDFNCADDSFCNASNTCELKNVNIKKICTLGCCVGDVNYVDKACASGLFCVDNSCQTTAECSANKPCATGLECTKGICKPANQVCADSFFGLVKGSIGVKEECNLFCKVGLVKPTPINVCVHDYLPLILVSAFLLLLTAILVFGLKKKGKGGKKSQSNLLKSKTFWKVLMFVAFVVAVILLFKYIFWIIVGLVVLLIIDATLLRSAIRREIFG